MPIAAVLSRLPWLDLGTASWFLKPLAHVVVYALIAAAFVALLRGHDWRFAAAWWTTVVTAGIDETFQRMNPPRSSSLADLVFDALGATIVVLILRRR